MLRYIYSILAVLLMSAAAMGESEHEHGGMSPQAPRRQQLRNQFFAFDRDKDGKLTGDEYRAFAHNWFVAEDNVDAKATRDAALFDLNRDGKLDLSEFLSIATLLPATEREAFIDPMQMIVSDYITRLERGFNAFSPEGIGKVTLKEYANELFRVLDVPKEAVSQLEEADTDRDQLVSRREAKCHIERLLAVRGPNNLPLRFPDGRVIRYQLWRKLDINWSQTVTLQEYQNAYVGRISAEEFFRLLDLNQDRVVTFEEFSSSDFGAFDLLKNFCRWDRDCDSFLSKAELQTAMQGAQQALVSGLFPSFDDNEDGQLSLSEFSLTPLSNETLDWLALPIDKDGDCKLSYAEFHFGGLSAAYPLLRWEMFRRYDTQRAGHLEKRQFDFLSFNQPRLISLQSDGRKFEEFDRHPLGFDNQLSYFSVGPLANQFCYSKFDRLGPVMVRFDGQRAAEVGHGLTPEWSPDGKKIAFITTGSRIGICNTDGSERQDLGNGIRLRWAPDSNRLAVISCGAVKIVTIKNGDEVSVFNEESQNGKQVAASHVEWSPDSQQLAVLTRVNSGVEQQIIICSSAGVGFGFKPIMTGREVRSLVGWHPAKSQLIFVMHCPERRRAQLYEVDTNGESPYRLMQEQEPHSSAMHARWTRDGTRIWVLYRD